MNIIHNTASLTTTALLCLWCSTNRQRHIIQIVKRMPSLFFLYKMILVEGYQKAVKTLFSSLYELNVLLTGTPTFNWLLMLSGIKTASQFFLCSLKLTSSNKGPRGLIDCHIWWLYTTSGLLPQTFSPTIAKSFVMYPICVRNMKSSRNISFSNIVLLLTVT
jgi:hypothetical protein